MRMILFLLVTPVIYAQQWNWPEKSKNLKVLPETTNAKQLQQTMFQFTNALGVRCVFCHVGEEGKDLSTYDFVSDEKNAKKSARTMMSMVKIINEQHLTKIDKGGAHASEISCMTCHHGMSSPTTLEAELMDAFKSKGVETIPSRYKELREKYYGGFAFDFSERSLISIAQKFNGNKQFSEAIQVLNLNLEYFPTSQITLFRTAQNYKALNDTTNTKTTLEKILKINPDHEGAKSMMTELNKTK